MKISDLNLGKSQIVEVKPTIDHTFEGDLWKKECFLRKNSTTTDSILLTVGEELWEVEGNGPKHTENLSSLLACNLPRICWISGPKQPPYKTLLLSIHEFPRLEFLDDLLSIGLDEMMIEEIQRKHLDSNATLEVIVDWLRERLVLKKSDGKGRIFLLAGSSKQQLQNSFRIQGDKIAIDVILNNQRYLIRRITRAKWSKKNGNLLYLVECDIQFQDATMVGEAAPMLKTQLDHIVAQAGSYLSIWREYNELEEKNIRDNAREMGVLKYGTTHQLSDGSWKFYIEEGDLEDIRGKAKEYTWKVTEKPPNLESAIFKEGYRRPTEEIKFSGKITSLYTGSQTIKISPLDLESESRPPEVGFLSVSLSGDETRLQRRKTAMERIVNGLVPMAQIGLILEEQTVPIPRRRNIKPLTPSLLRSFGQTPNAKQKEALRLALNTPDICLIQGPPGTGKTKVISALCHRLAEEARKNNVPIAKELLLTSFQHDAVDNMASRTEVYGLPCIKVGVRKGANTGQDNIYKWQRETASDLEKILEQQGGSSFNTKNKKITRLYLSYKKSPGGMEESQRVLQKMLAMTKSQISGSLKEKITQKLHQDKISSQAQYLKSLKKKKLLQMVRGLRTEEIPFLDDGPMQARNLLVRLSDFDWLFDGGDRTLLEEASMCLEKPTVDLLDRLRQCKNKLIDQLRTASGTAIQNQGADSEVLRLMVEVIQEVSDQCKSSPDGINTAVEDYLEDIEENFEEVRRTLEHYTAVLASTVQGAMGKKMGELKDMENFDTVIVDEAARANPLDLLIPMSIASKRIVLVGDHRQLPHLLEAKVEEELRSNPNDLTREALEKSLFEKLFRFLRKEESRDGISRVITLNIQYRMHPVLGDFISRTFYEHHGDPPIQPGRDSAVLAHQIPGLEGKVALWINVARSKGKEQKPRRSFSRKIEAEILVKKLKEMLNSNPHLSFGVIAFYRDQVEALKKAFIKEKLGILNGEGDFEIKKDYRAFQDGEEKIQERLRLKTVDAFQGKEFDVVFLSMTRSNNHKVDKNNPKSWRAKYGFLLRENRLNVAMSRAKRLLVTVGDSEMLQNDVAPQAVRGLVEFWKLTGGNHGLRL